nr:O-fucosyltransferase 16-like [Tanacetum cinerariifolium]
SFSEIFDVDWFISHLSRDVKIIRELPHKGGKKWSAYSTRVPRKCNERCYHIRVLPLFSKRRTSGKMISDRNIWSTSMSELYFGCSNANSQFPKAQAVTRPNRYLLIATSGGLNQQRTGITDAVVAARILNAMLVVPKLDKKSFWKDASSFSEIFDVDWFISHLSRDVKIIRELPHKGGKKWSPYSTRVPRKCNERCYHIRVLPLFSKRRAVQLSKFDYRLANKLETDFQKLRCRVNYHALRLPIPLLKWVKH